MADPTVVHIGENSPEYVAYLLLQRVATIEGKPLNVKGGADRKWLLDTYAECFHAVRAPNSRLK